MNDKDLLAANERLAVPPEIDFALSRRLGFFVVGRLAKRHGIRVQLRHSWYGGVTALVLIPESLFLPGTIATLVGTPAGRHASHHAASRQELWSPGGQSLPWQTGTWVVGEGRRRGTPAAPLPARDRTPAPTGRSADRPWVSTSARFLRLSRRSDPRGFSTDAAPRVFFADTAPPDGDAAPPDGDEPVREDATRIRGEGARRPGEDEHGS